MAFPTPHFRQVPFTLWRWQVNSCSVEKDPFLASPLLPSRLLLTWCGQWLSVSLLSDKVKKKKKKKLLVSSSLISYIFSLFIPYDQRDMGLAIYCMHLEQQFLKTTLFKITKQLCMTYQRYVIALEGGHLNNGETLRWLHSPQDVGQRRNTSCSMDDEKMSQKANIYLGPSKWLRTLVNVSVPAYYIPQRHLKSYCED